MNAPGLVVIHGEPSLELRSDRVRAWLTPRGGMLGPVDFDLRGGRVVQPYALAPWLPSELAIDQPPVLQVMRGDFFCFPFGVTPGLAEPHGPTANAMWEPANVKPALAELALSATAPAATIRKVVHLRPGETNLYLEHTIRAAGRFNYGHHPIIHVPEGVTAEVRTSTFGFGGVYPGHAVRRTGERGALRAGSRFTSLEAVPLLDGGTTSLRRYPTRPATEDIVMVAAYESPHAWTALTLGGYVWFSLRRTADFPGTLFWMSNGGRSFAPWCDRHTRRIGVEDICSHYCDGADVSARDLLVGEGIPTARDFDPAVPVRLRHVQGVVAVPPGFGGVAELEPEPGNESRARLRGESGASVAVPLDWTFLGA
jgi:hypothetical protein